VSKAATTGAVTVVCSIADQVSAITDYVMTDRYLWPLGGSAVSCHFRGCCPPVAIPVSCAMESGLCPKHYGDFLENAAFFASILFHRHIWRPCDACLFSSQQILNCLC